MICIDCILNDGHKNHEMIAIPKALEKVVYLIKLNADKAKLIENRLILNTQKIDDYLQNLSNNYEDNLKKCKSVFKE